MQSSSMKRENPLIRASLRKVPPRCRGGAFVTVFIKDSVVGVLRASYVDRGSVCRRESSRTEHGLWDQVSRMTTTAEPFSAPSKEKEHAGRKPVRSSRQYFFTSVGSSPLHPSFQPFSIQKTNRSRRDDISMPKPTSDSPQPLVEQLLFSWG